MRKSQKTIVGIIGFGIAVSVCTKLMVPTWRAEIAIEMGIAAMLATTAVAVFIALGKPGA
jgi:hypothetical protein